MATLGFFKVAGQNEPPYVDGAQTSPTMFAPEPHNPALCRLCLDIHEQTCVDLHRQRPSERDACVAKALRTSQPAVDVATDVCGAACRPASPGRDDIADWYDERS